jgi:hypothetical protein
MCLQLYNVLKSVKTSDSYWHMYEHNGGWTLFFPYLLEWSSPLSVFQHAEAHRGEETPD